jgi:arginine/lysine/ornithine decarboxylase
MIDDQNNLPYLNAIQSYNNSKPLRYHVPGHKGGPGAPPLLLQFFNAQTVAHDIPRHIRGVDVGANSPLEKAQNLAAKAWGAGHTFFLVNGASQGVLTAVLSIAQQSQDKEKHDDFVIVQSNSHISLQRGLVLAGLRPVFIDPELDDHLGIAHCCCPDKLKNALIKYPNTRAVFVTSPTYFGACANISKIAEIVHERDISLIVDESWGAHFVFHNAYPKDALSAGADLVISSTHKIIGSLTQSAMLHISKNPFGDITYEKVERALKLFETTSPSSLLMASLDIARSFAMNYGHQSLSQRLLEAKAFREQLREIPTLNVLDESLCVYASVEDYDPLSFVIDLRKTGLDGWTLDKALYEHSNVELELIDERLVVLLAGMHEPLQEKGDKLCKSLREVLEKLGIRTFINRPAFNPVPKRCELVITPREASFAPSERVEIEKSIGRIASEPLMAYPPGIPILLPGERISEDTVSWYRRTLNKNGNIEGTSGIKGTIEVVSLALDLLRSVPLFSILDAKIIRSLVPQMEKQIFPAEKVIFQEGEPGEYFYIVAYGEIEIIKDGIIINAHGRGNFFGEISLWNNTNRTATARAIKNSELFSLHRHYFLEAIGSHPNAIQAIEKVISIRLKDIEKRSD